jgi:exosortase
MDEWIRWHGVIPGLTIDSVRARVKDSCSGLVERSRLRPRVFRAVVLIIVTVSRVSPSKYNDVSSDRYRRLYSAKFPLGLGGGVSVSAGSISNTEQVETRLWSRRLVVWCVILVGLILMLYASVIKGLVEQWWTDTDYGYGFFVPLFSGYILWHGRERWTKTEIKPSNFGLVAMLGAVGLLLLGSLGAELFTSRFSLLVLLAGMILFLAGWKMLRAVFFPLGYLVWMIPIPVIIYNQITFPLQLLASRLASAWLELAHVPVLRDGNILIMSNYSLEVVEACSGIRSLMTLMALAVAYGYLVSSQRWVRYVLAAFMLPIAIVTNAIRVMGAGMLAHRFGPAAAEGFLHEFSGWAIFLVALVLMFGSYWILQHIGKRRRKAAHV